MKRFNSFTVAIASLFFAITLMSGVAASALPVITNGLVAAYEFNGNANDVSGGGNHGTVVGAVATADRFGNANGAYSFAPLAARVELNPAFSSHPPQLTYAAWIGDWQNTWGTIFGEFTTDGRTRNYFLAGGAQELWELTLATYPPSGAADAHIAWNPTFIADEWIHVAVVREGDLISGYVNGVLQGSVTTVGTYSGSTPFIAAIGSRYNPFAGGWVGYGDGTYQFRGVVDDLYIYDRALSPTEVSTLYSVIPEPNTALLLGLGLSALAVRREKR